MRLSALAAMDALAFLAKDAPGFAVRGAQVKILTQPSDFYDNLCQRAVSAKNRIVLASLYLGTGEREKQLVECVRQSLEKSQGSVRVQVLLDYCRGNRNVKGENSCTVLRPILEKYKDSCNVSLYHTPALRGIWKRVMPDKYNETIGLQHCKLYVFDDSVIISGANLSQDYFTNRQDRYFLVEGCPKLADFFENLTKQISEFSFQVHSTDGENNFEFKTSENWTGGHPYEGNYQRFIDEAKDRLTNFLSKQKTENILTYSDGEFLSSNNNGDCDTWIFPSIQLGMMGINHDSTLTTNLLESAETGSCIKFGTGYFNLTEEYLHVIMHRSDADFDVLMAHPKANGFLGAPFPAGGIPDAYTLIARKFYDLITKNGLTDRIKMFEYQRPGWTFHAKGLWYYLPRHNLPVVTLIGSPNFGYRSVEKDLEAQITVVTKNSELQKQIHDEQKRLFDESTPLSESTFNLPERRVPFWVHLVVGAARTFF